MFSIIFLYYVYAGVDGNSSAAEVQRYLELGVQMLARGQLHDALAQFHAAIDGDSNNYLSYYRRYSYGHLASF